MQRTAIAAILVMGALGTLAVTRPANAVVCAAGVYRAGCVGAHGAAVVRRGGYHSGAAVVRGPHGVAVRGPRGGAAVVRR